MFDLFGPKPVRSVAAFLWMPQFRLSFQHLRHLVPVFVRTLAMVFVQGGLLPRNHPALMYGIEGVKKYTFSSLVGEAWFTLRSTRATTQQWGIFISVMLLFAMIIGSFVTFLMTVAFGVGTSAQAQLFSHPNGGTAITDIAGGQPTVSTFYTQIPGSSVAQGDYGIMLLDKVLRAGAGGVGVPLQNATQALMQVYNSGVLVVASVMLFWTIISVVVDTAKTGVVGGGRHNMVWAPIRIVFALGLLIPLGTTGYSSGQFMVMKLAEWGSNLGTNAWVAYVNSVTSSTNLVADSTPYSATGIVVNYEKMWLCRVAYNAYATQGGNTDPAQLVGKTAVMTGIGSSSFAFTNAANNNLCGTVTYDNGNDQAAAMAMAAAGGPVSVTVASVAGQTDSVSQALYTFQKNMAQHYVDELVNLDGDAQAFATEFVNSFPSFNNNDDIQGMMPDLQAMVTAYGTAITNHFNTELAAIKTSANGPGMLDAIEGRGWAGMGIWYHRISQLNGVVNSLKTAPISISAGTLAVSNQTDDLTQKTRAVLEKYDGWWKSAIISAPSPAIDANTGVAATTATVPSDPATKGEGLVSGLTSGDSSKAMDAIVDSMGLSLNSWLIELITWSAGGVNDDVYPMALLANAGGNIFFTGATIMGANIAISVALGAADAAASINVVGTGTKSTIGQILATSYPMEFMGKLGAALMVAGMMLKFYVPLIPFIRTSFAVLTWIISVFEAVALVPIAALAHLTTEGEGLAGGAKQAWILWLNVLMRPVLTVLGYVGALLVFNGFVAYFHDSFLVAAVAGLPTRGMLGMLTGFVMAVAYVFIMYTAANTTFKMLDVIPSAMMRWMGGSADTSFDDNSDRGIMQSAAHLIAGGGGAASTARGRAAERHKNRLKKENEPDASVSKNPT